MWFPSGYLKSKSVKMCESLPRKVKDRPPRNHGEIHHSPGGCYWYHGDGTQPAGPSTLHGAAPWLEGST